MVRRVARGPHTPTRAQSRTCTARLLRLGACRPRLQEAPGCAQARLTPCHPPPPWRCPPPMPPHTWGGRQRPPRPWSLQGLAGRGQGRRVVAGVVGAPASEQGRDPPRQIVARLVPPTPQVPRPTRLAERRRRGLTHARAAVDAGRPPPRRRAPGPPRGAQAGNVRVGGGPSAGVVRAVNARGLLRRQVQAPVGNAARPSRPYRLGLGLTRAPAPATP